jgi:hypothetical protein
MKQILFIFTLCVLSNPVFADQQLLKGSATGSEHLGWDSVKTMRTVIKGKLAKAIFDHLEVESYILPGQDGEQTTKDANWVTCAHFSEKNYSCTLDVTPNGIGN